nr:hypothetical protein [uncultured Albidiferax sp.]
MVFALAAFAQRLCHVYIYLKEGTMAHLIHSMAYTGETPWHQLGNALPAKQPIEVWAKP